jgi:hypothetical protein
MIPMMKLPRSGSLGILTAMLALASMPALATSIYEYGPDEYVTISNGISPDHKLAVTTHGEGVMGRGKFHVYLFDSVTSRKIGPLEEIVEIFDTGAEAFGARWSKDSTQVTIVYRVDRHVPLKAMTYRLIKGRAIPATQAPVDVPEGAGGLAQFWRDHCSVYPSWKRIGTPKRRD